MSLLAERNCGVCDYSTPRLSYGDIMIFLQALPKWTFSHSDSSISAQFTFNDFEEALAFFNKVAEVSVEQNHHPQVMSIDSRRYVKIVLRTYASFGLTENDFIVAAKIDEIYSIVLS